VNRIDATFAALKAKGGKALIPYLTVGFPSIGILPSLVGALEEAGADLVELGVPFSDPLADGPTIQTASAKALRRGVTLRKVFRSVAAIRRKGVKLPLVLMTYVNPVAHYGVAAFCRAAKRSGADGVIIPDMPPEEAKELIRAGHTNHFAVICLAAPTSPRKRLERIVKASTGFIYYVSLTGVTGVRQRIPSQISGHVRTIQRMTQLPVCVGFGISKPAQVRQVARVADGVIVGSALINILANARRPIPEAARFIRKLRSACHG